MGRILRVVLVVALAAAACSGDDDVAAPTTTVEATTTTDAPEASRYGGHRSDVYADPDHWLCRPDRDDVCDGDMDATVVRADGTIEVERFRVVDDAPVDCFYVYPTISRDEGDNSDLVPADDAELFVVRQQAARLGSVCRVYAPVYRQVTLTSLIRRVSGGPPPAAGAGETAYADVLDAWKHYVDQDAEGRGVVLIGHSQGASVLKRLIAEEIDGDDELRDRLVSAILLGSVVALPEDLEDVPACASGDQTGCVVSNSSFRSTVPPPPGSFFGRPRDGEGVAVCTNPAALDGGAAELTPYFPADGQGLLGPPPTAPAWGSAEPVDTGFVTLPGLLTAECVERDGFSYLEVTVHGDPADPRIDDIGGDLTPEWGLHLVDVNVAMGDLVDLVDRQSAAFAERG